MDEIALRQIFSIPTAAWTGVALLALFIWRMWNGSPAMFQQWIEYRKAKAAEKAADWTRLRDEAIRLGEAEERCRRELVDVVRRLAELEGFMMGKGKARQDAANIVALERLEQEKKP